MSKVSNSVQGNRKGGFGAAPVYFTAISSILGAILFLRLGYATGMLGFWGALAMILVGHLITIPTALAVSELATNTRVEGGGEYFIISRSLGLKVGTTIGVALFLSQAISVAFYTISFAEAFQPLFQWWEARFGWELPRQAVSVPTLLVTAAVILKKGAGSGLRMLYMVVALLFVSLLMFFLGKPVEANVPDGASAAEAVSNFGFYDADKFFIIFAICFPAFTGMTAGVGLSGELRDPGKAIPVGTMLGTLTGLLVYIGVIYKLSVSAPQALLISDQLVMSKIAVFGNVIIPLGLAAATLSSAIGGMLVAPRTLQAIAYDKTIPLRRANIFLSRNSASTHEPRNASIVSYAIALVFVLLGDVNSVAQIISMFFLITYGTLCLSSFLNHFGAPPSYRPRFKSRWYISLAGFVLSLWVMFRISQLYTIIAYVIIILIYIYIEHANKNKKGLVNIFKGVLFQLNRKLQVYMQKHQSGMKGEWRPAALCISSYSFERDKVMELMKWISYRHGFGTYFHYIKGYYDRRTFHLAQEALDSLIQGQRKNGSALYIDTMISPSYTSAIAQVIQTPSISGMENNMVVFEYDQRNPEELEHLFSNIALVRAGNFDVCVLASSEHVVRPEHGIHVWINEANDRNTNLMILLGYIIMAHPDWKHSYIKIFLTSIDGELPEVKKELQERIAAGRLPITMNNIEIILVNADHTLEEVIEEHSKSAALTLIGFHEDLLRHDPLEFFTQFRGIGDILFVNSVDYKEIR